jgi:hypothetical protein
MNPSVLKARDHEWLDYYERFPCFSAEAVRDGCHPRIMEHEGPAEKAIVLVHSLTDSPHFMTATISLETSVTTSICLYSIVMD